MTGRKDSHQIGGLMNDNELMESINKTWCELEESMGEMAALEVACEQHGKDSDWFYGNIELIAIK